MSPSQDTILKSFPKVSDSTHTTEECSLVIKSPSGGTLLQGFHQASLFESADGIPNAGSEKSTISFRVTASEKAQLQQMARALGLSGYIRQCLFGDKTEKRPKRYLTKTRKPKLSHVEVARILGMLGQSELATGILALSLAMEAHDRTIAAEETALMRQACDTVQDIKDMLIIALGVKPQQESVE